MTMPKATIYKNDRSVFAQYNIRMPRKSRVIQSISETTTKQEFPYQPALYSSFLLLTYNGVFVLW